MTAPRILRVLIVDDFEDTAMSLGELLRLYGHDCRVALSGAEAPMVTSSFVRCMERTPGHAGMAAVPPRYADARRASLPAR